MPQYYPSRLREHQLNEIQHTYELEIYLFVCSAIHPCLELAAICLMVTFPFTVLTGSLFLHSFVRATAKFDWLWVSPWLFLYMGPNLLWLRRPFLFWGVTVKRALSVYCDSLYHLHEMRWSARQYLICPWVLYEIFSCWNPINKELSIWCIEKSSATCTFGPLCLIKIWIMLNDSFTPPTLLYLALVKLLIQFPFSTLQDFLNFCPMASRFP